MSGGMMDGFDILFWAASIYFLIRVPLDIWTLLKMPWKRTGETKTAFESDKVIRECSHVSRNDFFVDSVFMLSDKHKAHLFQNCVRGREVKQYEVCKNCLAKLYKKGS